MAEQPSNLEALLLQARDSYRRLYDNERGKAEPFRNTVTSLRGVLIGIDSALRWNNLHRQVSLGLDHLTLPEPQFFEDDPSDDKAESDA